MSQRRRDHRETISSFIEKAHAALGEASYYEVLGVERNVTTPELRARYYALASRLHPDLYGDTIPEPMRRKLTSVYSRVVEAYKILTDGVRRAEYDAGLAEGKVRFDADAAARPKIKRIEDDVPDGPARKFFLLGRDALRVSNAKAAIMNLKMALSMAPGNETIKAELARAEAMLKEQAQG